MPWTSKHTEWLIDTEERLKTADGKEVEVWEFQHHNDLDDAEKIERFQNEVDHPYKEVYGAVALFENSLFDGTLTSFTDTSSHPHSGNLALIVIKGPAMMKLVHELYRRAADEA